MTDTTPADATGDSGPRGDAAGAEPSTRPERDRGSTADRSDGAAGSSSAPAAAAGDQPKGDDGAQASAAPDRGAGEAGPATGGTAQSASADAAGSGSGGGQRKRRRGSRGGRNRSRSRAAADTARADGVDQAGAGADEQPSGSPGPDAPGRTAQAKGEGARQAAAGDDDRIPELPERASEGRPSPEAAEAALVPKAPRKPQIGDTRPAPPAPPAGNGGERASEGAPKRKRRRGGRGRGGQGRKDGEAKAPAKGNGRTGGRGKRGEPVEAVLPTGGVDLDEDILEARRGRERKGRPVGRYLMAVHVTEKATQIAVLEGRNLIEHYVSRPQDDISQIHGNIYLGKVQNVLPGMEAAFVDIATPKNAVLYRGDVHYDPEDVERGGAGKGNRSDLRIEQILKPKQTIICQVTKNPIGAKGARLTQEVSLPGRFVVLIPNSSTYGISKRLSDDERKRLRRILDAVKPAEHGVIVRTAAEGVTDQEIENDVRRLVDQWNQIDALAKKTQAPALLYREPDMAVRVIREEFNSDYRGVIIDDRELYESVRDYVASISPELADRVEYYDPEAEALPLYEKLHIHEQLHKALDRKVWLPSGGSLIIEHTEALTVIDVNTGKNVGTSSLEETVFKNNLEAAEEIARQLRLRDIGGIIVVDFIDMEIKPNRDEVVRVFREALARDKTRTQVFEISELGLCEMTRKRIGEGLLESFAGKCPTCEGRGVVVDEDLLPAT
ncbi:MAG TPA: Rne/Rng family ribonuclease [Acidimicrobiales bacterium]|nr:Rne/Rng family ribonuclease [Acidimicrobiales bacterium]